MTKGRGVRHPVSAAQERELWTRLKQGEPLSVIGRSLAISLSSLYGVVRRHGGIAPAPRTRAARVLRTGEREEISRGLAMGRSVRGIARALGRAPSTISREIARHDGRIRYRAAHTDRVAWRNARRPKACALARHPALCAAVAAKLADRWAPQQIAGWLMPAYPDDPTMRVSHETIYRSLYLQAGAC